MKTGERRMRNLQKGDGLSAVVCGSNGLDLQENELQNYLILIFKFLN
jgi:hypothetical protein